ncbi:cytochrome P450 [Rhodococcus sp. T2V]|uniref:cytochrome P450 n=1 Tax=Rhodococcus sp. T2V TaxID=3034164 RepID=UPI0023E28571|nr:cytochrome P450 [Rhodococcus sp. T2V]MDF3313186.1 cytochrome P450 [Rhodococcus sp. T2V]
MVTHTNPSDTAPAAPRAEGPILTGWEAVRVATALGYPAVAAGVIARRRPVMAVLETVRADDTTLETVRALRRRFGSGPVQLRLPGRRLAVVLDPEGVARVLAESPDPFTPANREKKSALSPFQPRGVLISGGHLRRQRRDFNEAVLDTSMPVHHLAPEIVPVIAEETNTLLDLAVRSGRLDAGQFTQMWWRIVRRIVFGSAARDDETPTDRLWRLRGIGNWSYLSPDRPRLREKFFDDLYRYVGHAEPGSLAATIAATDAGGAVDPVGQMPHWLFAFDAAGIACSRALALLATHPDERRRAEAEVEGADLTEVQQYRYLRAVMLDSVRLWPTTPAILRDSTEETGWGPDGRRFTVPAGAAFLVLASAFHRDGATLEFADRFVPQIWLDGRAQSYPQLVPFSAGPAECPGRNLVLLVTSTVMAHLLARVRFELTSVPGLSPDRPLPTTLNNFGLRFAVHPR